MKLAMHSALFLLAALAAAPGCASSPGDEADATDGESEEALSASAKKVVGLYSAKSGVRPPTFRSLRLSAWGDFEATVDSGIRCAVAPCPSFTTFYGTFTAGTKYLTLKASEGVDAGGYAGRYRYQTTTDGGIHLTRSGAAWSNWSNDLERAPGILPDDATQVIAESPGGGFMRPAPAGSNCAGQQKYKLDVATRAFTYSYCVFANNGPWLTTSGSKTLTKKQADSVLEAFSHASIYVGDSCGADKPLLKVSVKSPAGTKTYTDSFYACHNDGEYIEGIGEIFAVMGGLSK